MKYKKDKGERELGTHEKFKQYFLIITRVREREGLLTITSKNMALR